MDPIDAFAEKVSDVTLERPNVAMPVGTAAGAQLAAVFQLVDPGARSQVAFCARALDATDRMKIASSALTTNVVALGVGRNNLGRMRAGRAARLIAAEIGEKYELRFLAGGKQATTSCDQSVASPKITPMTQRQNRVPTIQIEIPRSNGSHLSRAASS